MDQKYSLQRSLPPLVEGKIHGFLDLTIDQIIWTRRSPGNVTVVACWWGELDNAQFSIPSEAVKDNRSSTESYAIKTNFELFREYLKNAESLSLSVLSKKTQQPIGAASVTNLQETFAGKLVTSVSIYSSAGLKLGEMNVSLHLARLRKNKPRKEREKIPEFEKISPARSNIYFAENSDIDSPTLTSDHYRSILREKRRNLENKTKNPLDLTDNLVAQVVARARKLRGALADDSSDPLALSDSIDSSRSDESAEKEAALYKYLMGTSMSCRREKKVLETLRTQSPTPSLIDFAVETIKSCRENPVNDKNVGLDIQRPFPVLKEDSPEPEVVKRLSIQRKEASPIDYVDSVRVVVDSLRLTPAGFRRVKSSCLSRGEIPVSVTYFVQYDPSFLNIKMLNRKTSGNKPVKMCSKQQNEETVYFNHEAVYSLPKSYLRTEVPLKFKIFNRHLNQRTPAELGVCSVHLSDAAKSPTLGTTQRLAVVKKGIKIGELKVSVELGCDRTHFGKQFVEAVTSTKENIPVLELSPSFTGSRYKSATGESKSSRATSVPEKKESLGTWSGNNSSANNIVDNKSISRNAEKQNVEVEVPRFPTDNTLLHGLIYIGDGRDLPDVSTYLICRTFWREDRAVSKVYTGRNPFYNFYQLVPLIHNQELLERTKDNCIITEVYSKNATEDSLIGIAKLPVHQLYVAYRDPLVLQHLLKAKYPVISVDGWVSVTDPVTGRHCGEIYALVALGTAEQIALLEMTRGIRTHANPASVSISGAAASDNQQRNESPAVKTQECQTEITVDTKHFQEDQSNRDEAVIHTIVDRLAQALGAPKTIADQSAQTEFGFQSQPEPRHKERQKIIHVEPLCLENLNNSQSFSAESSTDSPRENFNLSREIFRSVGVGAEFDEPPDQTRASNSCCDHPSDSDEVAGTSFHLVDNLSRDYEAAAEVEPDIDKDKDVSNEKAFRAMVEIDCALHLPKVQINTEISEPCTYVTFQKFRTHDTNRIDAYLITNVCPYSSSPKYEWRCETKLPTDLLIKEEKRLVMKVWRLLAPQASMAVNLEKDILVGISAIDLSVLTSGFPTISGWYHIMDFTGKSNGQLKITVTPLENVQGLGKSNSPRPAPAFNYTNLSSPYSDNLAKQDDVSHQNDSEDEDQDPADDIELKITSNLSFGGIPTSILSQSLNDKMDQIKESLRFRLNEVTSKAFEDLAQQFDPTEQDFELEDNENDKENDLDNINVPWLSQPAAGSNSADRARDIPDRAVNGNGTEARPSGTSTATDTGYSSASNPRSAASLTNGHCHPKERTFQPNANTHTNGSAVSVNGKDSRSNAEHSPYRVENPNSCVRNSKNACSNSGVFNPDPNNSSVPLGNNQYRDRDTNHPVRGTRMHINHLLDKLSPQIPLIPPAIGNSPMKRSIMDLLTSLRHNNNNNNNNNLSNNVKCNREVNLRTVPTQTDNFSGNARLFNLDTANWLYHDRENGRDDAEIPAKTQKREKISTVIREELIADDQNNDTVEYDFLSAQLMTSNVRHMGAGNTLNPLLYPHLIPDIPISEEQSSEGSHERQENNLSSTEGDEAVERLENRYVESFNATVNKSLKRLRDQDGNSSNKSTSTSEIELMSTVAVGDAADGGYDGAGETGDVSRVTPSGVSENVDGNIDVTVIHKPCNDDLMACNSGGSTAATTGTIAVTPSITFTTTSTTTNTNSQLLYDNDMQTVSEIDDSSSLNSSETSVSVISRQAPDGGNPIEDPGKFASKPNDHEHDDSSES